MEHGTHTRPSRHNVLAPTPGGDRWVILNPLSGNADLLSAEEAQQIRDGTYPDPQQLEARGYWVDPEVEASRYRAAYLDFLRSRDADEVQLFFAPGYACNFACDYCYQESYPESPGGGVDVVEALLHHIDRRFAKRRKYVTLFGGEPLLPSASRRAAVEALVDGLAARAIDLAVVTNGYHLPAYLPLLQRARLREIQITLDGPAAVHNRRRPLLGGGATFDNVVAGVDACLAADVPVNLRVVVDRENLDHLADLADFAVAKGWTEHPLFKTQLGRNYELHTCSVDRDRLFGRLELHQALHNLIVEHPNVLAFHKPAFSVMRFLAQNGALPAPLFDACPGAKTEWAFDGNGGIYACTATVGKPGEELGRFWPTEELREDAAGEWEDRDVLAIDACGTCPSQLVCGGGCAAVAKNRTGDLHGPDCRPIPDLIGLGADLYLHQPALRRRRRVCFGERSEPPHGTRLREPQEQP